MAEIKVLRPELRDESVKGKVAFKGPRKEILEDFLLLHFVNCSSGHVLVKITGAHVCWGVFVLCGFLRKSRMVEQALKPRVPGKSGARFD